MKKSRISIYLKGGQVIRLEVSRFALQKLGGLPHKMTWEESDQDIMFVDFEDVAAIVDEGPVE